MDITKIFAILTSFLLIICLTLAITTLTVLRNTVAEAEETREEAARVMLELQQATRLLDEAISAGNFNGTEEPPPTVPAEPATMTFWIRESNEKITVTTGEGQLIYLLELPPAILPREEREALKAGICLDSWETLFSWIQAYSD